MRQARHATWIPLLALLTACQSPRHNDSEETSTTPVASIEVLHVASSEYRPPPSASPDGGEAAACRAWSLDATQAQAFFRLSRPLAEGELHDFDWLPCSIRGRLQADGREWAFEINAAGTSTWRNGDDTRLLGCDAAACEPYVVLMPGQPQD